MGKFLITRDWLAAALIHVDVAAQPTFSREEIRAILCAAWKGMGYLDSSKNILEFVPRENPNGCSYQSAKGSTQQQANEARSRFRIVTANDD
jgi:hypothetical protein